MPLSGNADLQYRAVLLDRLAGILANVVDDTAHAATDLMRIDKSLGILLGWSRGHSQTSSPRVVRPIGLYLLNGFFVPLHLQTRNSCSTLISEAILVLGRKYKGAYPPPGPSPCLLS
jgi:hypothetical protein